MGLSEQEKRALEELEKSLYADDARFVQRVATGRPLTAPKIIAGILLAVVGISLLVFAAILQFVPIGLAGFILMLVGLLLATSGQVADPSAPPKVKPQLRKPPGGGSFFEDRWNSRG